MKYDYSKLTKEIIQNAVKCSTSYFNTMKKLNLPLYGSTYPKLKLLIKKYDIDTSHFLGYAWNKGKNVIDDGRVCKHNIDKIFSENSPVSTNYIRKLIKEKSLFEYKCDVCKNNGTWLNKSLILQLDHKNGNRKDQRLENLRWICPNCHSQTDTFCSKNIKRKIKISDDKIIEALKKYDKISDALKSLNIYSGGNYYRIYKLAHKIGK